MKSVSVLITIVLDGVAILQKLGPFIIELNTYLTLKLVKLKEDLGEGGALEVLVTTSYQ